MDIDALGKRVQVLEAWRASMDGAMAQIANFGPQIRNALTQIEAVKPALEKLQNVVSSDELKLVVEEARSEITKAQGELAEQLKVVDDRVKSLETMVLKDGSAVEEAPDGNTVGG